MGIDLIRYLNEIKLLVDSPSLDTEHQNYAKAQWLGLLGTFIMPFTCFHYRLCIHLGTYYMHQSELESAFSVYSQQLNIGIFKTQISAKFRSLLQVCLFTLSCRHIRKSQVVSKRGRQRKISGFWRERWKILYWQLLLPQRGMGESCTMF